MGEKKKMSYFRDSIKDINFAMARFCKYQIIAKFVLIIVMLPTIKWIMDFLMKKSGFSYITNNDLLKFGLSLGGMLGVTLMLLTLSLLIIIQLGGLIVLCHQSHLGEKESSFLQIFKFLILKVKSFLGMGVILGIIALVVIAPYSEIDLDIVSLKIPGFINDFIVHNVYLNLLLKALTGIGIVIATLCIFSVHIIILEDTTVIKALKKSFKLVIRNFKLFVKEVILSILLIILWVVGIIAIYLLIGAGVYFICSDSVKLVVGIIIIIIFLLVIFFIDMVTLPIILMMMTKVYYKLNGQVPLINLEVKKGGKVKRIVISFSLGVIMLIGFSKYAILDNIEALDKEFKTSVTAHRGSSIDAPENTLSSLKLAITHKADFAELDVQEAKDGSLVITHDSNFKRTAGVDNNVWDMTLEDIKKLDVGSSFDEKFKEEQIPTLQEYIDVAKGNIKLNIEIKKHGHDKNLVASVVKLIEEKGFIDNCVVTSLDYDVLQEVERLNSKIKTGYITYIALGDIEKLNVDFYSVEETNITKAFVEKVHKANREVHAWTINREEDMDKMIGLRVDNIITDNDELAISKVKESINNGEEFFKGIEEFFK